MSGSHICIQHTETGRKQIQVIGYEYQVRQNDISGFDAFQQQESSIMGVPVLVHNTLRRMLNAIPLHFFPLIKMLQQRTIPSAAKMRRYINNNPASRQDGETQRRIELNFGCLIMMEWANHSFSLTHTLYGKHIY